MSVKKLTAGIKESLGLSLGYFEPKELEILLLTSLKSTLVASWLMLKYFFWLIIWGSYIELVVGNEAIFANLWEYVTPAFLSSGLASKVFAITLFITMFLLILSVRASLQAKKTRYYVGFLSRAALFAGYFFLLPQFFLFPVFWFASFFFFDARHSVQSWARSLGNGFILTLGYLPFIAFVGVFHGAVFHLHNFVWKLVYVESYYMTAYMIKFATSAIVHIFFVAMLGALYTRIKHANGKLFMREKGQKKSAATS